MRRLISNSLLVAGSPLAGLALGCVVVFTAPTQASVLWLVWAPLAVGLGFAAGATLPYGVNRWRDLAELRNITFGDIALPTVAVGFVGIIVPSVTVFMSGPAHITGARNYW